MNTYEHESKRTNRENGHFIFLKPAQNKEKSWNYKIFHIVKELSSLEHLIIFFFHICFTNRVVFHPDCEISLDFFVQG